MNLNPIHNNKNDLNNDVVMHQNDLMRSGAKLSK